MQEYFEFDHQKIKIPDEGYIGSFQDICNIEIEGISPIHAKVYHSEDDVIFVDLLSAGSSINGLRVEPNNPVKLKDYDVVELCSIKMVYRQVEDPLFMDNEAEFLNDQFYKIAETGDATQLIDHLLSKIDRVNSKVSDTPVVKSDVFNEHYSGFVIQEELEQNVIAPGIKESVDYSIETIEEDISRTSVSEPSEPIYLPESLEKARQKEIQSNTVSEETSFNLSERTEETSFDLSERTMDIDVKTIKALTERKKNQGADFNQLATKINS